jgi:hypothetical protein
MTQADSPQDRQQGCLDFLSARLVQHRAAGSNRQRVKSKGANMTIGKQLLLTASVSLLLLVTTAAAQTTAFTYQGKLTDSGNLATGNYDLQFKLFDALSAGTQLGTTQTISNVTVTNGIFTVQLDFGACPTCFDGSARFLEIAVRPAGGGAFTTLSPRQQITSTPYALKSQNAATADGLSVACVNCVTSSQIASVNGSTITGTIPVASVPPGSGNYIQNTSSQQASSNFNISGTGTADIFNATTQFNLGNSRVLSTAGVSNLFAGISAGANNTSGSHNAFVGVATGSFNTTGANNAFFGAFAGFNNVIGSLNTFIGRDANFDISNPTGNNNTLLGALSRVTSGISNATAIGALAQVSQSNSLVLGGITGTNGGTSVNVGIGTTTPSERLHVVGNGLFSGNLTVSGTYTGSIGASSITGVLARVNGGTGLSITGAAGNYLRSNGTNWSSSAIQAADVPTGSANYIQNRTTQQASSNFNISGDGVIGGDLTVAGTLTATIPRRKYYMTSATPAGNAVINACVAGYHMASLAEIFNTSVLEYDMDLVASGDAHSVPDSGSGPPFSTLAFIRVGVAGANNAIPGNANCVSGGNVWSTNSAAVNGTAVALNPVWNSSSTNISPWDATVRPCSNTTAPVAHVWCVQN